MEKSLQHIDVIILGEGGGGDLKKENALHARFSMFDSKKDGGLFLSSSWGLPYESKIGAESSVLGHIRLTVSEFIGFGKFLITKILDMSSYFIHDSYTGSANRYNSR